MATKKPEEIRVQRFVRQIERMEVENRLTVFLIVMLLGAVGMMAVTENPWIEGLCVVSSFSFAGVILYLIKVFSD